MANAPNDLIERAIARDKLTLGRLISAFEDTRAPAAERRKQTLSALAAHPGCREARFVGITGTPGAGKSSLIGELALRLIGADPSLAVAVLAVDPSSHVSGGALLGDRTRVRFPADEDRLFFRSQASDRDLGGVGRNTFPVCRLLHRVFDLVFVETVGIGQSEIEVQHVADFTYLVLQPMAGDQVQFMKAGIMEIPDAFILNKCDEAKAAQRSYHALQASLGLTRQGQLPIHRASAKTGEGLDLIASEIHALCDSPPARPMRDKERYFFSKWVRDEYGRAGLRFYADHDGYLEAAGNYEDAQLAFSRDYSSHD